jgi:hypothetical protein
MAASLTALNGRILVLIALAAALPVNAFALLAMTQDLQCALSGSGANTFGRKADQRYPRGGIDQRQAAAELLKGKAAMTQARLPRPASSLP